uniref:Uncharacterized protein n=1 Tax=Rhodococcus sp. NS1 TaxID=402236 RepID=A0A097SQ09_9NOCA|nr:hypothetical protein LRS1606.176 [Rhodococcus sp. NS1]
MIEGTSVEFKIRQELLLTRVNCSVWSRRSHSRSMRRDTINCHLRTIVRETSRQRFSRSTGTEIHYAVRRASRDGRSNELGRRCLEVSTAPGPRSETPGPLQVFTMGAVRALAGSQPRGRSKRRKRVVPGDAPGTTRFKGTEEHVDYSCQQSTSNNDRDGHCRYMLIGYARVAPDENRTTGSTPARHRELIRPVRKRTFGPAALTQHYSVTSAIGVSRNARRIPCSTR